MTGIGLLCVTLLMRLRKEIDGTEPGTVVHVIATDPADLPAWCCKTGHDCLGPVPDHDRDVCALRFTAKPTATRPRAPWHQSLNTRIRQGRSVSSRRIC